jgi:antitoxin HicB
MVYYCKMSPDGDGFMVQFPDMPNVVTGADTTEQTLQFACEALNGVLESDVSSGILPPDPAAGPGKDLYPIEVEPHIDIAIQLRKLRGDAPQKEIAAKLGFSYQAYQRLENPRKGNPTVKTLENLARVLGKKLTISIA